MFSCKIQQDARATGSTHMVERSTDTDLTLEQGQGLWVSRESMLDYLLEVGDQQR